MRKLFALLLLGGIAYYLYAHGFVGRLRPPSRFTLPNSIAFRWINRVGQNPPTVQVCLFNGNRWRIEAGGNQSQRTLVGVFDGTQFASSAPKATAELLDPRPTLRQFIEAVGRASPEATEQRDGRTCWRFTSSSQGKSMKVWLDTNTHFPVYVEGILPDGERLEWHLNTIALDLDRNSAQYFDTRSTAPLFSNLLKL